MGKGTAHTCKTTAKWQEQKLYGKLTLEAAWQKLCVRSWTCTSRPNPLTLSAPSARAGRRSACWDQLASVSLDRQSPGCLALCKLRFPLCRRCNGAVSYWYSQLGTKDSLPAQDSDGNPKHCRLTSKCQVDLPASMPHIIKTINPQEAVTFQQLIFIHTLLLLKTPLSCFIIRQIIIKVGHILIILAGTQATYALQGYKVEIKGAKRFKKNPNFSLLSHLYI